MDRLDSLVRRLSHLDLSGQIFDIQHMPLKGPQGASCDVYTGHRTLEQQQVRVVIKRLRVFSNQEHELAKRLVSEMYIWSKLDHKNVLPLVGFVFEDGGLPHMVSDFQDNGTLYDYLPELPRGSRTLLMVRGIASGLLYLHTMGVIHADLKSPNVFISRIGQPVLADFGLSHFTKPSLASFAITLGTYNAKGTLRWMAPELFPKGDNLAPTPDAKADVWAFGMIVYELLTRKLPFFEIKNDFKVIEALQEGQRPSYLPEFTLDGLAHHPIETQMVALCYRSWIMPPQDRPDMHDLILMLGGQSELTESCILLCKDIDPSIDTDSLVKHFHCHGTIINAQVMRDIEGNSREFGFVIFQTPEQACVAMELMNGAQIGCKAISIYVFGQSDMKEEKFIAPFVLHAVSYGAMPQSPPSYPDAQKEKAANSFIEGNQRAQSSEPVDRESEIVTTGRAMETMRLDWQAEQRSPSRRPSGGDPVVAPVQRLSIPVPPPMQSADSDTTSSLPTPQPPFKMVDFALPLDVESPSTEGEGSFTRYTSPPPPPPPPPASAPEHPSTPKRPAMKSGKSVPGKALAKPVHPTELAQKLQPISDREKLLAAVLNLVDKGKRRDSSGSTAQRAEEITDLLMGLPKRDRALCIFNIEFLKGKVLGAIEVLDAADEDERDEDEAIDFILRKMQPKVAVADHSTPSKDQSAKKAPKDPSLVKPLHGVDESEKSSPVRPSRRKQESKPVNAPDTVPLRPSHNPPHIPLGTSSTMPIAVGPSVRSTSRPAQQSYSLATLSRLSAKEIIRILRKDANVGWKLGLGKDGSGLEDRVVVAATDKFVDEVLLKTKLKSNQQKQAIGKRCFDTLKAMGVKHLKDIVITLVDTEDLRSLAHLEASFPEVLKEKALCMQLFSK